MLLNDKKRKLLSSITFGQKTIKNTQMKASIALADDHVLLRNGLANLLKELDYDVLFEADNGKKK